MRIRIDAAMAMCLGLGLGLACGVSRAAIVGPFHEVVQFTDASDLDDFTSLASAGGVNGVGVNAGNGSNGVSGRLQLLPESGYVAGQRVLYYTPEAYSDGLIQMATGGLATLSIDFLPQTTGNISVDSGANPRIGFNANSTDNFSDNSGYNQLLLLPRGSASKTLSVRTFLDGDVTQDEGPLDLSLTAGTWYRMGVTLSKTATDDLFEYDSYLATLDGSGNILSVLRTQDGSFSNPTLYDSGMYAFVNYQIVPSSPNITAQFTDRFDIQVVPEPSAWVLVATSLMVGGAGLRRFQSRARA